MNTMVRAARGSLFALSSSTQTWESQMKLMGLISNADRTWRYLTVELAATGCSVCKMLLQVQSKKLHLAPKVPELKMFEGCESI